MYIAERKRGINDYINSKNSYRVATYFVGVKQDNEVTKHYTNTNDLYRDYPEFKDSPVISEIGKSEFNINVTFINGNTFNFNLAFDNPHIKNTDIENQIMTNGAYYEVTLSDTETYLLNVSTISLLHVKRI